MIDPISIGLAFTAVQQVVGGIKGAINTGKDINSIVKDIGKFLSLSADINKANVTLKLELLNKSSQELEGIAFETAWMANQVAQHRKELKELLIWSGHGHIWENMVREHTRLLKEKYELEQQQKAAEAKRKKELAENMFKGFALVSVVLALLPLGFAVFRFYLKV